MSKFSGKCDVFDWFGMIAKEDNETPYECFLRRKGKLYANCSFGNKSEPISIKKPSDFVLYYPYVSAAMLTSSINGDDVYLSSRPYPCVFLDIGNQESYAYYTDELMKEYWRVKEEEDPKYVS